MVQKTQKLYCYVDETGQDTEGMLFIVVSVVVARDRDQLDRYLEETERTSGIGKKKWVRAKSTPTSRDQYLESIITGDFKNKIFYSRYSNTGTGTYEYLTVLAIAKSVTMYREKHRIGDDYKVSITIDGLKGSEGLRVGRELRELGIKSRKIRGARDQSEPFIRLADRIAGLVRDTDNNKQAYSAVKQQLEKQSIISKI
jgi:hypothetical protein